MGLSKEQILAMPNAAPNVRTVAAFGDTVYVKKLSAGERDALDLSIGRDRSNWRAKWAVACLCDESGNSLGLTDADIPALAAKEYADLDAIFDACVAVNKVPDVETAEKNS